MFYLIVGANFKMADEVVDFESDTKRVEMAENLYNRHKQISSKR